MQGELNTHYPGLIGKSSSHEMTFIFANVFDSGERLSSAICDEYGVGEKKLKPNTVAIRHIIEHPLLKQLNLNDNYCERQILDFSPHDAFRSEYLV